jgi:dolichol-phosphate mannosyltransferase
MGKTAETSTREALAEAMPHASGALRPAGPRADAPEISVVVPMLDEAGNVEAVFGRIRDCMPGERGFETIFVDDGSTDGTLDAIKRLAAIDGRVKFVSLSRNFGHQIAIKAGIDHACGACVITLDGDLQHPPELIPRMIEKWREGYQVVYTKRRDHMSAGWFKTLSSRLYYYLLNRISDFRVEPGTADFRLIDRRVADLLGEWREQNLFWRGIIPWLGFRTHCLEYEPEVRHSGASKYTLRAMARLSAAGVLATSLRPLRFSITLGLTFAGLAVLYGIYAIVARFGFAHIVPGWASIIGSIMLVGGVQLIMLGIIGHYLGQVLVQSRGRPIYIVREQDLGQYEARETQEAVGG